MSPALFSVVSLLIITSALEIGHCLQCYDCSSRLGFDDYVHCRYGKTNNLRKVECIGPSVCATYILTTETPGYPPSSMVNRGCQAIRYGSTCEDIFNELRRRGSVFPGRHECSTCSTDYCNSSSRVAVPVFILCVISFISPSSYL
ncbi:hypothetical protein WA026_001525 [Henosepilachna vigintioctopunctata]|uniref:Protein sleepless n=1 Tax=Henosepilachna vigintioctopunctata TaxID=420089 RepID=A0AAW1UQM1_9CUCU